MIDRPNLRKVLDLMFPTAADLDAFLVDYFSIVHSRSSSDIDRKAKTSRILLEIDADLLLDALKKYDPLLLKNTLSRLDIPDLSAVVGNPFQRWGTLPPDSLSYIKRSIDDHLISRMSNHARIAIGGESQIGKSSLMRRIQSEYSDSNLVVYVTFEELVTYDVRLFHERFFGRIGRELSGKVIDWDSFEASIQGKACWLFIDEFGLMNNFEIIEQFFPRLLRFIDTKPVCLVTAMPIPMGEYLKSHNITNPKYTGGWMQLIVPFFDDKEIYKLVNLLPVSARAVANKNMKTIIQFSKRRPQRLQRLCYLLYEASTQRATDMQLQRILEDQQSYKDA